MNAIDQLKAVLCDTEGKCCIAGSDEDRAIVDSALERTGRGRTREGLAAHRRRGYVVAVQQIQRSGSDMTKDEIIRMGKECGFAFDSLGGTYTTGSLSRNLKDFANLVAAAERKKTEPATVPHTVSREEFLQKYYLGAQRTINYLKIENQQLISSGKVWKDRCLKLRAALVTKDVSLPEQEQEPVACDCRLQADECNGGTATFHPFQVGASCSTSPCERVYTSPPQRQPLTDDEIDDLIPLGTKVAIAEIMLWMGRAVEAAHGIGEKA